MSRTPCTHCQRLWSAQSLVAVGAAELCPVCYKQRRWARSWPCINCTPATGRTLVCHDKCYLYAAHRKRIWAAKPSVGDRLADDVNNISKCRSIRQRGTSKVTQR